MINHKPQGFKYLFGPVPSRRLGMSLGVDLVLPKTCSLDCVYCESGRTTVLTTERSEAVSSHDVIEELSICLSSGPKLDYVTFSGCGEPLLNRGIRDVVRFMKRHYPDYPLALLTNGTLFFREEVRRDVLDIDVIVASLDAVSESVFKQVNRPEKGLDSQKIIQGLIDLRKEFSHDLWLEIFIVPGVNDTAEELKQLSETARKIGADKIQLNSLDRPGTESWVRPLDLAERQKIANYFKGIDIIGEHTLPVTEKTSLDMEDIQNQILAMIKRRPCTSEDLQVSLHVSEDVVKTCLEFLSSQGQVKSEKEKRGVFYRVD